MTPTKDLQPEPDARAEALHRDDTVNSDTQQDSTFLNLPIETRLNIYSYLVNTRRPFTPNPIPNVEQRCRARLPAHVRVMIYYYFLGVTEAREKVRRNKESLLHVCRTMRQELAPIYYRE